MERRVAITGIGVIAPGGVGTKEFWSLLCSGRTATRRITFFDPSPFRSQVAGEADFDPAGQGLSPAEIGRLDRAAQSALAATRQALADSGLDAEPAPAHRTGVSLGTAVGCSTSLEREYVAASTAGRDWLVDHRKGSPFLYEGFVPHSLAPQGAVAAPAAGPGS